MILKPFKEKINPDVKNILGEIGIAPTKPEGRGKKEQFADALDKNGAGLAEIASALGQAIQNEKTQVPALRLAMEGQGLINDKSTPSPPSINIIINDPGSSNVNILDLVRPR